MLQSGDRCKKPGCPGFLYVYRTQVGSEYRFRWVRCGECGEKPAENKIAIPLAHSRRREDLRKRRG